jgi:periplasmic protein CpxP/Spy
MTGTSNRAVAAAAAGAFSLLFFLATANGEGTRPAEPALPAGSFLAQAAPLAASPAPAATAQPSQRHRMSRRHGMRSTDPTKDVEGRITDMHKRLAITADQEPQFKAYADVLRGNAQAMHDLFQQRAQASGANAVDRLHWYAKLTAAHADAVNKLVPPFEALYQSLSDTQKKAADAEFGQIRQRRPAHKAG